jgi:hypothetical protein
VPLPTASKALILSGNPIDSPTIVSSQHFLKRQKGHQEQKETFLYGGHTVNNLWI